MDTDTPHRLTPARAALIGRLGAYALHARGLTTTTAARAAFNSKFVEQARALAAEQGEQITDVEAARRGEYLRRAHFARLGLKSAAARRRVPTVSKGDGPTAA